MGMPQEAHLCRFGEPYWPRRFDLWRCLLEVELTLKVDALQATLDLSPAVDTPVKLA